MAIEFRCPKCDKKLKTSDEKAGRTAKCPQCGASVTVPSASSVADEFEPFQSFDDPVSPAPPRRAGNAGAQIACPMCGAMNAPTADRCYACGEDLVDQPGAVAAAPRPGRGYVDIGEALSGGWSVFRDQLGGLLALFVVATLTSIAAMIPLYMLFFGGMAVVMGAGGGNPPNFVAFGLLQIVVSVLVQLVVWFISIGFTRSLLLLVRRRELEVGAIFSGGRYYGLMALNSAVVFAVTQGPNLVGQLLQTIGMQNQNEFLIFGSLGLSLISLALTALVYPCIWPYTYIIVDERAGTMSGLEPLRRAWRMTPGSRLASFGLFLLLVIINIGGLLAFCIGILFTAVYAVATLTVAYEQLSPRLRAAATPAGNVN